MRRHARAANLRHKCVCVCVCARARARACVRACGRACVQCVCVSEGRQTDGRTNGDRQTDRKCVRRSQKGAGEDKGSDTLALATCAMLVGRLCSLPGLVQRLAQRSVRRYNDISTHKGSLKGLCIDTMMHRYNVIISMHTLKGLCIDIMTSARTKI